MVFICVLAMRGPGWVLQLVSTARIWEVGGNCSIRGATRRRHAVTGLLVLPNPHLPGLLGRWVRLGEAWAVSGGCGAFGRFSRFYLGSSGGCNGGNCSIRGATRRRHAAGRPRVVQNPHSARCVGGIRCPEGCGVPWRGREHRQFPTCVARESQDLPNGGVEGAGVCLLSLNDEAGAASCRSPPFFRGADTGQIAVGLRHVCRVRFRLSGGRCGGV